MEDELPLHRYTYSNDNKRYPSRLEAELHDSSYSYREYYVGLCCYCFSYKSENNPLHRCSGCQLVAYCSKDCQKDGWFLHKPICKQFPIKNGQNAFERVKNMTKGDREKCMGELKTKAIQTVHSVQSALIERELTQGQIDANLRFVSGMFDWPRVCNICNEANPDKLTDCICHAVSYCSKSHRKADKDHIVDCTDLQICARSVSYCYQTCPLYGDSLDLPVFYGVDDAYNPDNLNSIGIGFPLNPQWADVPRAIWMERISFPLTLLYAMGRTATKDTNRKPIESFTSLNIHVLSTMPMLDSSMWELLFHRLPLLKELNISFVGHNMQLSNQLNIGIAWNLERCEDCKIRNRLITYSIHPEHYHMYFSSNEYRTPDVIALFDNKVMFQEEDDGEVHATISYKNMTYNEDTLIILTGPSHLNIDLRLEEIKAASPVDEIFRSENPLTVHIRQRNMNRGNPSCHRGYSTFRGTKINPIGNLRDWVVCITKKKVES